MDDGKTFTSIICICTNPNAYLHENSLHFSPIFSSLCIMYAKRAEIRADLEIDFEI